VRIDRRWRNYARRAASAAGISEERQRRALELLDESAVRDRKDDEHLMLLMAFSLPPDGNCIDVGAHNGDILREMVRIAPEGRHIAYEPLPDFADRLEQEFPEVDVRRAALSDEEGTATFTYVKSNPGYSGFKERRYPGEESLEKLEVRTERLDSALPDGYVPALIKIDVEGAELQVLKGGIETIARHRPVIVFEHGKGATDHYGAGPDDVYDLLSEAGLRIFDIDGSGPYTRTRFEDAFTDVICNFVARA
jgi:FkbM family methyltransferase